MHFLLKCATKNEFLPLQIISLWYNKDLSDTPILQIPVGGVSAAIISGVSYVFRAGFFPIHVRLEWRKWQLDESGQLDDLRKRNWLSRRSRGDGFFYKQLWDL